LFNFLSTFLGSVSAKIAVGVFCICSLLIVSQALYIYKLQTDVKSANNKLEEKQAEVRAAVIVAKYNQSVIEQLEKNKQILIDVNQQLQKDKDANKKQVDKLLDIINAQKADVRNKAAISPVVKATLDEIKKQQESEK
jgi:preprotein translocase subunit SecF